jgi:hypothetical protein
VRQRWSSYRERVRSGAVGRHVSEWRLPIASSRFRAADMQLECRIDDAGVSPDPRCARMRRVT